MTNTATTTEKDVLVIHVGDEIQIAPGAPFMRVESIATLPTTVLQPNRLIEFNVRGADGTTDRYRTFADDIMEVAA